VAYDSLGSKGTDQRDRAREAQISFRYLRGWLFDASAGWRSVRSNSLGYSLGCKSLEGGVSGWMPTKVLLLVRGRFESVTYHDPGLDRIYVPRSENLESSEDNNSLMVRIRRRLIREIVIDGRASWFRNESPFIGLYYKKAVVSLGLSWTPVGTSDF
jgi:hypothetical protein